MSDWCCGKRFGHLRSRKLDYSIVLIGSVGKAGKLTFNMSYRRRLGAVLFFSIRVVAQDTHLARPLIRLILI
jgi:hypothetical protein